ncbi:hypothetical protein [Arcticibacter sp. MXS-1]|uniref:hypothetical protein n=1 Tax=Arcticibacter sp. MXS-1 TaxID=3341726 RepID=UPI0035A8EBE4
MHLFLKNLIPRLKQYSTELSRIEQLVDKTWLHTDDYNNLISYRFLRDGTLLITNNGIVEEGTFVYLPPDSLYLKFGEEKRMFSQNFIINGILVLQIQSRTETPFILYDPKVVLDGDVQGYLKSLFLQRQGLDLLDKTQNFYIERFNKLYDNIGKTVYDENFEPVSAASISLPSRYIEVVGGVVKKELFKTFLQSEDGILEVRSYDRYTIAEGDLVFVDNQPAEGSFRFKGHADFKRIDVMGGVITSIKQNWDLAIAVSLLIATVIVVVALYALLGH